MTIIRIKQLFLRGFIGFSDHELGKLQDVVLNIEISYHSALAEETDNPADALNYKLITKRIVDLVEHGRFNLIESLARKVLNIIMDDPRVESAKVQVDKPHALRFADSVSVELSASRND